MGASSAVQAGIDHFLELTGAPQNQSAVPIVGSTPPDASAFSTALAAVIACGSVNAALSNLTGFSPGSLNQALALSSFTAHVRCDGQPVPKWASLSGHYRTADDRFIQLHCNFPHHAAGAAARLGVAQDRSAFEDAISHWDAFDLETALIDDGMIAAAYRTMDEWNDHSHANAVEPLPLLDFARSGYGPSRSRPTGDLPLIGVHVLDCSRVLAGPVAGQTLANLGADVLRIGADHLPSVEIGVMATGTSKRNASVDLRTAEGRATFTDLVKDAHVVIDAFRPGALAQYGFSAEEITALSPGVSVIEICAFDWVGPWAGRRGFDSIVQSTTGIAVAGAEQCGSAEPVHLPVQSLDYCTGFFAAAAAIRAIAENRVTGGSWNAKLSLIRTRNWFVALGGPKPFEQAAITPTPDQLATVPSDFGELELVRPFVGRWSHGPKQLGTSEPVWR